MKVKAVLKQLLAAATIMAVPATALAQEDYDPTAILNFATNADPTLNPWTPGAVIESNLINTILFDQLTRYDKEDLSPSPGLAIGWEAAEDSLSWTFQLREGVLWSDGEPFTAEDVAFTFNDAVLVTDLGANNSSVFSPVENVEVIDDHTVRFNLNEPFSALPIYLAYYAGILPEHVLGEAENPLAVASFNKSSPVVTGPYKVREFVPGAYIHLEPNENYWGGTPRVGGIVFRIIADVNTQVAQLMSGELDMATITNPALLAGLERNQNLSVIRQSQNLYYFTVLNHENEKFQDARVRQALTYALDRPAMISAILEGYGTVANGPIAPIQQAFYREDLADLYPYDPERALQLLTEAGWERGDDGLLRKDGQVFEIDMPTGQYGYLVPATLLVQQYWEDLGIRVNVDVMEWNAYIQQVIIDRDFEASLAWWSTPPTPDIAPYHATPSAGGGNNIPAYSSEELDALLDEGRAARTLEEQQEVYGRVQELVAEDLPYGYLWYPDMITVRNYRLQGIADINQATAFQYAAEWFVTR